jgi:hypothetical protein
VTRSRSRLAALAAAVAAGVVVLALVLAGGAGGDEGSLAWKDVEVFPAENGSDRILYGQVENTSLRDVDLDVREVRLADARGREVESAVRFSATFAHGIFPWSQKPDDVGDFERRRLGEVATVKPGQAVPITLSWRTAAGAPAPVRADLGPVELDLPRAGVANRR